MPATRLTDGQVRVMHQRGYGRQHLRCTQGCGAEADSSMGPRCSKSGWPVGGIRIGSVKPLHPEWQPNLEPSSPALADLC